jgi:hypothetical protein
MGRLTRVVGRAIVALLVVGLLAAVFAWRAHVPVGSTPPATSEPPAHTTPDTAAVKPAPKDVGAGAPGSNARLLDAYLFFLAALDSHHARGAMNSSGGLGHAGR